jgi:tRNA pseudouridine38-40 synthase
VYRLKLTLQYDGTDFSGWQRQKKDRSVQAVLESALRRLYGKPIPVVGAGRTDSGVHAKGQVAHTTVPPKHTLPILHKALNAILPEDLLVQSIRKVPNSFHARYSAKEKWYRYTLWNDPSRPIFDRKFLHTIPTPLDLRKMQQAARKLQGKHDFWAFHSTGREVASTIRNLKRLSVQKEDCKLIIDAKADGFLYHMVRRLTGVLIEVGRGKVPPSAVDNYLRKNKKKVLVPPTAPAKGLCLMGVKY